MTHANRDLSTREILSRRAIEVAPELLGWRLTRWSEEGAVTVELTEVEAYMGEDDPASHAARGLTARNEVMFGAAGHLYTYLSYGIHWCANIVTGPVSEASAVLLRAGKVVRGHELARQRRGGVADRALARGPGCLGQALGLGRRDNGADLLVEGTIRLEAAERRAETTVSSGKRVGVRLAHDVPWRFWLEGEESVSSYRRNPRAPTA
jgi:DNA-3-methyladenine glycosylase